MSSERLLPPIPAVVLIEKSYLTIKKKGGSRSVSRNLREQKIRAVRAIRG